MLDWVPLWFWYVWTAFFATVLAYRIFKRRKLNRRLERVEDTYRYKKIVDGMEPSNPIAVTAAKYLIQQERGDDKVPDFEELTEKEKRIVSLAQAADVMTDQEYDRALERLNTEEKEMLRGFRDLRADGPLLVSLQIQKDRLNSNRTATDENKSLGSDIQDLVAIEMSDLLSWLENKAPRNPGIWHELPMLNWDYAEDLHDILLWVVQQPECDASTAIDILFLMQPDVTIDRASGGKRWVFDPNFDPQNSTEVKLLEAICQRSEGHGFPGPTFVPNCADSAASIKGTLGIMERALEGIEKEGRTIWFPLPVKLLSQEVSVWAKKPTARCSAHDDVFMVPKEMV